MKIRTIMTAALLLLIALLCVACADPTLTYDGRGTQAVDTSPATEPEATAEAVTTDVEMPTETTAPENETSGETTAAETETETEPTVIYVEGDIFYKPNIFLGGENPFMYKYDYRTDRVDIRRGGYLKFNAGLENHTTTEFQLPGPGTMPVAYYLYALVRIYCEVDGVQYEWEKLSGGPKPLEEFELYDGTFLQEYDGVCAVYEFRIPEDAPLGNYHIEMSCHFYPGETYVFENAFTLTE